MTFVLYLDRVCLGQAAPIMQEELGISDTALGFVHAAFTLAYAVFEIPTGRWGDRYGSRGVLTRIVIWWSLFTALTGAATGLWMLLSVRFLFGAGEAGALPNSARILKQWFPESARGEAQGIVTTGMMIGGAAAPVASQFLINGLGKTWTFGMFGWQTTYEGFGWRWTFVIFGLIGLTWAVSFYFWFRDDPADHRKVNRAERKLIKSGQKPERPALTESEVPASAMIDLDEHFTDAHEPIPWKLVLPCANIWLLGGAMMTMSGVYYMLFSWYPKYLQSARGVSAENSSWLTSLVLGAGAMGCYFGGRLTDWLVAKTGNRRWGRTAQCVVGAGLPHGGILASIFTDSNLMASICIAIACFGVQIQVPAWWASATQVSGRHLGCAFRHDEYARRCRWDRLADLFGSIRRLDEEPGLHRPRPVGFRILRLRGHRADRHGPLELDQSGEDGRKAVSERNRCGLIDSSSGSLLRPRAATVSASRVRSSRCPCQHVGRRNALASGPS